MDKVLIQVQDISQHSDRADLVIVGMSYMLYTKDNPEVC